MMEGLEERRMMSVTLAASAAADFGSFGQHDLHQHGGRGRVED
jgi:hypothetical protein